MSAFKIPEMEADEFKLWQSLLESHSGLWLPESRKAFLITNLCKHMRAKKIKEYKEFYTLLELEAASSLDWANLVDSLTVHETYFYRDKESLDLVKDFCTKKAINNFNLYPDKAQHIHLWSVGCSTGEETYTLAIEMEKLNISLKERYKKTVYYGVTGVDVSYPSLRTARDGVYSNKKLDFIPTTSLNSYFNRLDDKHVQVKDEIKQRTCFIQTNLLDMSARVKQHYDVIFCQNVMIYFRQERKESIVNELEKRLKPGGILILGHGEVTSISNSNLTRIDNKHCLAFVKSEDDLITMAELS